MFKRVLPIGGFLFALSVYAISPQIARADDPVGAKLFGTYCAGCHGAGGTGGGAPAIGSAQFLKANGDAAITRLVTLGNISKGMPAWSKSNGGTLADDQISSIVAYLRSLETNKAVSVATGAPQTAVSAYLVQTKLIVFESVNSRDEIVINAQLEDHTGYPVPDASLSFNRVTSWGVLDLGSAKTGPNGVATLVVENPPLAARDVAVNFKGNNIYDSSASKFALVPPDEIGAAAANFNANGIELSLKEPILVPEGSLITSNPPLVPATMMALVLLAIWSVYSYVAYQLFRISRLGHIVKRITDPGESKPRENVFNGGRR